MGFLGQIEPKLQKLDLKIVFIDGKNHRVERCGHSDTFVTSLNVFLGLSAQ